MKKKEVEIAYRVADIRTAKFVFGEFEEKEIEDLIKNDKQVELSFGVTTNFDDAKSLAIFDILTDITKNGKMLIKHIGRTAFEITGLEQLKSSEKGEYDFPQPLLEQLYGISFSHARALLATETARTSFSGKFFLPVIDPRDFLKNSKQDE